MLALALGLFFSLGFALPAQADDVSELRKEIQELKQMLQELLVGGLYMNMTHAPSRKHGNK